MEPIPIKKLIYRVGVIILVAILSLKASVFSTAIFFLFVLASNKVSFEKILKTDFAIRSFVIVVSTILYLFGFATDNILRRYSQKVVLIRNSIGYVHPNTAFLMVFVALLDYLILSYWKKNLSVIRLGMVILVDYIYQWQTGSRSSFIILCMASVLLYMELRFSIT